MTLTQESLERLGFLHSVRNGQDCYVHESEMKQYIEDTHCTYRFVVNEDGRIVVSIGDNECGIILTILETIDEVKQFWWLTHKIKL